MILDAGMGHATSDFLLEWRMYANVMNIHEHQLSWCAGNVWSLDGLIHDHTYVGTSKNGMAQPWIETGMDLAKRHLFQKKGRQQE